nr:hypothetical protein [Tanacetum cinerariifolium]
NHLDHDGIDENTNHEDFGLNNLQIGCNLLHDAHTSMCHRSDYEKFTDVVMRIGPQITIEFIFPNHIQKARRTCVKYGVLSGFSGDPFTRKRLSFYITFAMSTQQDIYAGGSETRPPMLNKENYVSWSLRLLRYAKIRPNEKLIYNSIINGPYVRRMIPEPGDQNREVPVPETNMVTCSTNDERLRYRIQEKKAKLFNECERFTSTDGELIESYYHRLSKLMNDFKRNKHFSEMIASNLKFLNNLQPEWSRHVVDDLRAERFVETQDLLALMANSNNPFNYLVFHPDLPSSSTYIQQTLPKNNYNPQPPFNQNYMEQPMLNPEDITDPTTAMNMTLVLMAKAFELNYSTQTNNNQRISSNPRNRKIAQPGMNLGQDNQMQMNVRNRNEVIVVPGRANQAGNGNVVATRDDGNENGNNGNQIRCYNCRGLSHLARNCTFRPMRKDAAYLQTQLLISQKEEARIQLQAEEFDLMAAVADLDQIEKVNANCILMANLQQASTLGIQSDKAPIYDSDGSAEYTELLEPIPEPHQVLQNNSNVTYSVSSVEKGGGTVEQHPKNVEDTHVLYDSLYNNLATEVEKVKSVNRKLRETNANLTTKLARYKNQEKCFEISQEKYDKLERCYQQFVYQEQCLTKKINALHLSSSKQITTLNEEISKINKQILKEKSTVSSLQEEKKMLKSDFKIREDELLDKQIQLENKIKELDNILVKAGQSIQMMHMLLPKPDSFYHTKQKMALGYQNSFYLKQA